MAEITSFTCPNCGSSFQSHNILGNIQCSYCRSVFTIKGEGTVKELKSVQIGVDRTASELAISRLKNEIAELFKAMKEFREPNSQTAKNLGFLLIFILLIGVFITNRWGENGQNIAMLLGTIIFVVAMKVNIDKDRKLIQDTKQKRKNYELQIEELQRQLQRHQDIVSKI